MSCAVCKREVPLVFTEEHRAQTYGLCQTCADVAMLCMASPDAQAYREVLAALDNPGVLSPEERTAFEDAFDHLANNARDFFAELIARGAVIEGLNG